MTELRTTASNSWSVTQAAALALASLLVGVSVGWMVHNSARREAPKAAPVVPALAPPAVRDTSLTPTLSSAPPTLSPMDLKTAADSQAAALVEQLKADPANAALLTKIGNIYYDAKQYPTAIDYYQRSLRLQPSDTSVRTDMGTAYWYDGEADSAIAEFQKVLSYEPNKANALFNLGIVKWKGKNDPAGAIAAWQKLLTANPGFEARAKVEDLIAQAQATMTKKP